MHTETRMHTYTCAPTHRRRTQCEDEGRVLSEASTSLGMGRIASNHQKLEAWYRFSESLEGADSADTLISHFEPPERLENMFLF